MLGLKELLQVCEEDTRRIVNAGAAKRLAAWRQYKSEAELVAFIARLIRIKENQANGFFIDRQHGVSLESIVAIHLPSLFTEDDIRIAKQTLGMS